MTAQQEGGSTPAGMVAQRVVTLSDADFSTIRFRLVWDLAAEEDQAREADKQGAPEMALGDGWRDNAAKTRALIQALDAATRPEPACSTPAGEGSGVGGHTPTPWVADGCAVAQEGRSDLSSIAVCVRLGTRTTEEGAANAAFIVHAVNSHAGLVEALRDARRAVVGLGEFDLGGVDVADTATGESVGQYGVRDELLSKIDAALARSDASEGGGHAQ